MRNPQRFEGLEEDKITWYSNAQKYTGNNEFGLEEGKITWYSNDNYATYPIGTGLEGCEITWFSNIRKSKSRCFVRKRNYMVLKPYSR